MSVPTYTLDPARFAAAFPFHVVFDQQRTLLQVGAVLARIAPDIRPGAALGDVLPTAGSTAEVPFDELVRQPNLVALLRHPPTGLMLRGAVHQLGDADNGPFVFLGSPWVQTAAELVRLGLTLSDFAAHDATSDVTQLAQIHRLAQDDLRKLNQLQRSQQQELNALLELSPDGIIAFNRDGAGIHANASLRSLLGTLLQGPLLPSLAAFDRLLEAAADPATTYNSCLELGDGSRDTIELVRPRPMTLQRSVRELRGAEGTPGGCVFYLRDITHETEVDRMKTEFLTTAAHELRTPLASIHGFTELLMVEEFPRPTRTEMLTTMHRQSTLLVKLVNELLDLARIEARAGKDLHVELLPLLPLLREVVDGFYLESEAHRVQLELPEAALWVTADRAKLTQAVSNVLSNACKYSPAGNAVEMRLLHREGKRGAETGISIIDQGIGMSETEQARIFERFFRADPGGAIQGTGLGMSLVKEFLELMGGSVEVASALGAGTTVTLWLPASDPPAPAPA